MKSNLLKEGKPLDHPLMTLIQMLDLPAGLVNLDPLFKFEISNQKLTKYMLGHSEDNLNSKDFLDIEKKLADIHTESVSKLHQPYCIKTNNLLSGKPTLFVMVPIYGDTKHKNLFIFAFASESVFKEEAVLHDSSIWHDINNPLAILMLAASKIDKKQILEQNEIDNFFGIIKEVTIRINSLMKKISESMQNERDDYE